MSGFLLNLKDENYLDMAGENKDFTSAKLLAKGAGLVFVGLVIGRLLGYLTRLVVARYLGPSGYGLLILGFSLFSIVSVVGLLGLQGGMIRFSSEFSGKNQKGKIRASVSYALKISILLSALMSVMLFFSADYISDSFFHSKKLASILQIFALVLPFSAAASIFLGAIMGMKYPKYRVYAEDILKPGSRLVFLVIAIFFGFGVIGSAVSYALSFIVAMAGGLYFFNKMVPGGKTGITHREKKSIVGYSWPIMMSSIVFIIMAQINSLLLGSLKAASDVGVFNAAVPTADMLIVLPVSIMSLFLPVISGLYSRKNLGEVKRLYAKVVRWILITSFPLFLIFIIFPAQILNILFGLEYASGSAALGILSVGYFISVVLYPSNDAVNLFKKTKLHFYISVIAVFLNTGLGFALIRFYGLLGAAMATAITYSFIGVSTAYFAYKLGLSPYSRGSCKVLVCGIVTFMAFSTISFIAGSGTLVSGGLILLMLPFYFALVLRSKVFDSEDISIIEAIESRLKIKSQAFSRTAKKFLEK